MRNTTDLIITLALVAATLVAATAQITTGPIVVEGKLPEDQATTPPETGATSGIVIAPPGSQPAPIGSQPPPAAATDMVLIRSFANRGLIREGGRSPLIPTDSWRPVTRVEIQWTDEGGDADGSLFVNGEWRSRWDAEDVSSPGRVAWDVNDHITGIQIGASGDDLALQEVLIRYTPSVVPPGPGPISSQPHDEYDYSYSPLQIREGGHSGMFMVDPSRRVSRIELSWGNVGRGQAVGRIHLTGTRQGSLPSRRVGRDGEVASWSISTGMTGFHIRAHGGDLQIYWLRVHYAGSGTVPPFSVGGPHCCHGPTMGAPIRVSEDTFSPVFVNPDPGRVVRAIRVLWSDDGNDAVGHLTLNGERRSRLEGAGVSSPGEARWAVNVPVQSFRIYAEDDPLWLTEVWIEYE